MNINRITDIATRLNALFPWWQNEADLTPESLADALTGANREDVIMDLFEVLLDEIDTLKG